jgi:hypothetical protein
MLQLLNHASKDGTAPRCYHTRTLVLSSVPTQSPRIAAEVSTAGARLRAESVAHPSTRSWVAGACTCPRGSGVCVCVIPAYSATVHDSLRKVQSIRPGNGGLTHRVTGVSGL